MARVLQVQGSIDIHRDIKDSKSRTKDVFDSPSLTPGPRQTESTTGVAKQDEIVDSVHNDGGQKPRQNEEEGIRDRENERNLISAWRTYGATSEQSPVERAKARLASWYVSVLFGFVNENA